MKTITEPTREIPIAAEADVIVAACNVDGLRSMILDVEVGSSYFVGDADAASAIIRRIRAGIPADFHLGHKEYASTATRK